MDVDVSRRGGAVVRHRAASPPLLLLLVAGLFCCCLSPSNAFVNPNGSPARRPSSSPRRRTTRRGGDGRFMGGGGGGGGGEVGWQQPSEYYEPLGLLDKRLSNYTAAHGSHVIDDASQSVKRLGILPRAVLGLAASLHAVSSQSLGSVWPHVPPLGVVMLAMAVMPRLQGSALVRVVGAGVAVSLFSTMLYQGQLAIGRRRPLLFPQPSPPSQPPSSGLSSARKAAANRTASTNSNAPLAVSDMVSDGGGGTSPFVGASSSSSSSSSSSPVEGANTSSSSSSSSSSPSDEHKEALLEEPPLGTNATPETATMVEEAPPPPPPLPPATTATTKAPARETTGEKEAKGKVEKLEQEKSERALPFPVNLLRHHEDDGATAAGGGNRAPAYGAKQMLPQATKGDLPYGSWALVTGASSGLGKEIARDLSRRGFHLVLVARRGKELRELRDELEEERRSAITAYHSHATASVTASDTAGSSSGGGGGGGGSVASGVGGPEMLRSHLITMDLTQTGAAAELKTKVDRKLRMATKQQRRASKQPKQPPPPSASHDESPDSNPQQGGRRFFRKRQQQRREWREQQQQRTELPQGIDLLACNAGVADVGTFLDMSPGTASNSVALNVRAPTELVRSFAPGMAERGRGRILVVSSVTGGVPNPRVAVYAATKAFLQSFGQALAFELAPYGVGVTTAMPGAIHGTDFAKSAGSEKSLYQYLPFYSMPASVVARRTVDATLRKEPLVVPGLLNKAWLHVAAPLLPRHLRLVMVNALWSVGSSSSAPLPPPPPPPSSSSSSSSSSPKLPPPPFKAPLPVPSPLPSRLPSSPLPEVAKRSDSSSSSSSSSHGGAPSASRTQPSPGQSMALPQTLSPSPQTPSPSLSSSPPPKPNAPSALPSPQTPPAESAKEKKVATKPPPSVVGGIDGSLPWHDEIPPPANHFDAPPPPQPSLPSAQEAEEATNDAQTAVAAGAAAAAASSGGAGRAAAAAWGVTKATGRLGGRAVEGLVKGVAAGTAKGVAVLVNGTARVAQGTMQPGSMQPGTMQPGTMQPGGRFFVAREAGSALGSAVGSAAAGGKQVASAATHAIRKATPRGWPNLPDWFRKPVRSFSRSDDGNTEDKATKPKEKAKQQQSGSREKSQEQDLPPGSSGRWGWFFQPAQPQPS